MKIGSLRLAVGYPSVKLLSSSFGFARAWHAFSCGFLGFVVDEIVLRVPSFSSFQVSTEDFKEQGKPIVVKGAHNREENSVECDIGLEMLEFWRVLAFGEEEINNLGQSVDPSAEPKKHAYNEGNRTWVLVYRSI